MVEPNFSSSTLRTCLLLKIPYLLCCPHRNVIIYWYVFPHFQKRLGRKNASPTSQNSLFRCDYSKVLPGLTVQTWHGGRQCSFSRLASKQSTNIYHDKVSIWSNSENCFFSSRGPDTRVSRFFSFSNSWWNHNTKSCNAGDRLPLAPALSDHRSAGTWQSQTEFSAK